MLLNMTIWTWSSEYFLGWSPSDVFVMIVDSDQMTSLIVALFRRTKIWRCFICRLFWNEGEDAVWWISDEMNASWMTRLSHFGSLLNNEVNQWVRLEAAGGPEPLRDFFFLGGGHSGLLPGTSHPLSLSHLEHVILSNISAATPTLSFERLLILFDGKLQTHRFSWSSIISSSFTSSSCSFDGSPCSEASWAEIFGSCLCSH